MHVRDLFVALWVNAGFAVIFVWLPAKIFPGADESWGNSMAAFRRLARMIAINLAGVMALVTLRIFNPFTLLLLYASLFLLARVRRYEWRLGVAVWAPLRRIALLASDLAEVRPLRRLAWDSLWIGIRAAALRWLARFELSNVSIGEALITLALTVSMGLTILLRFTQPVLELRLGHPDSYQVLLAARQLLTQQLPARSPVLPSLVAAVSLVTSTDPMQVVRFIDPTLGCLLAIALGTFVYRLTTNRVAALAALYVLGVYVFAVPVATGGGHGRLTAFSRTFQELVTRQWSASEVALGTLLLLTGFVCLLYRSPGLTRQTWVGAMCSGALVVLTFLPLLTLVPLFAFALWTRPKFRLASLAIGWIVLALGAGLTEGAFPFHRVLFLTLPVGVALLGALLALVVRWLFGLLHPNYAEAITAALLVFLALVVVAVPVGSAESLEYDATARQVLRIQHEFPRQHWTIVAPVEQLAEVYGIGGHLDLAQFVARYQARVKDPGFQFSLPVDVLFVFVEKRPFSSPWAGTRLVPFETMVDPTYRDYRSPAGRASVEFQTFDLCESYRLSHPDASIYYEDEILRVYRFRAR